MKKLAWFAGVAVGILFSVASTAEPYPDEVKAAFIEGCEAEGGAIYCGCLLQGFEDRLVLDSVLAGEVDPKLVDEVVAACVGEVELTSWPEEGRTAFLKACKGQGTDKECTCMAEALAEKVPYHQALNGALAEEQMAEIVSACIE